MKRTGLDDGPRLPKVRASKPCRHCGQPILVRGKPRNDFEYQHASGCPQEPPDTGPYAVIPRVYVVEYHDGRGWRPTFGPHRLTKSEAEIEATAYRRNSPSTRYRVRRYEPWGGLEGRLSP